MNKKALIYDFDGVICNSVNIKTEAFCMMYEKYGSEIVKKVKLYHIKHGGISRFEKFKYYHKEFFNQTLSEIQVHDLASEFSKIVLDRVINCDYIKGSMDFIKNNSSKYNQFICTGTPQNEIKIILEKKKIKNYFVNVYGSPKSKTKIIEEIKEKYKYINDDLIFFGDADTDYLAAKKCNIDFIAINSENYYSEAIMNLKNFKQLEKCQLF